MTEKIIRTGTNYVIVKKDEKMKKDEKLTELIDQTWKYRRKINKIEEKMALRSRIIVRKIYGRSIQFIRREYHMDGGVLKFKNDGGDYDWDLDIECNEIENISAKAEWGKIFAVENYWKDPDGDFATLYPKFTTIFRNGSPITEIDNLML